MSEKGLVAIAIVLAVLVTLLGIKVVQHVKDERDWDRSYDEALAK